MDNSQWIVVGVGGGAFLLGIVFIIMGILSRRKLEAIRETPTVNAAQAAQLAGPAGTNKVEMRAVAESPAPLTAPASGTRCLYYRHNVEEMRERVVTDTDGSTHTEQDWVTVTDNKLSAPFVLRDETGTVSVTPDGAEFVPQQTMNDQMGAYGYEGRIQEGSGGVLGGVLDSVLDAVDGTSYFRTSEWVIPLGQPVYVLGTAVRTAGGVEIQEGEGPFIISYKSEEGLTRKYTWHYVLWLVFGVLFGGGGIAAAVYGAKYMKK